MTKKLLGAQPVLNTAVVIALMSKQGDLGHHFGGDQIASRTPLVEALCVCSVLVRLNHAVRWESGNVSGSLGVVTFPQLDSSFLWKKRWPCVGVC